MGSIFSSGNTNDNLHSITQDYKYYLSEKLNENLIKDIRYSIDLLNCGDDIEMTKFIDCITYNCHGYILFKTSDSKSYMSHLTGTPGDLAIVTEKANWDNYIQATQNVIGIKKCNKTIGELKEYLRILSKDFGPYESKNNNCQHFSSKLCDFLENKKIEI